MNDLVLTALINLFALFCTSSCLKRERAKSVIYNYLVRFFGIRNYQEYLDMYDTLCDVYELSPPDEQRIVTQVCQRLKNEINAETQALMVLRLMEFSSLNIKAYREQGHLFKLVAQTFGVGDAMYGDFENFIAGAAGKNVGVHPLENGRLRVLRLPSLNRTVVAYDGEKALTMNDMPIQSGIFMPWEKNGIIKSAHIAPIYYTLVEQELLGNEAHASDVHFTGSHVDFRFKNSDNGLHDFSFALHSGELVAIMGGSGTGKSTLMNILSGSLRPDSGSITINGEELYDNIERLKPIIGFVPQDDLLIAELTVYQNLWYTALFCFPRLTDAERDQRIVRVLQDLDLLAIKGLKVGSPLNKTISGGQRKRLNIALELIREPQILFLDEPTSGLSSADSEKVVHLLKKQTYQGRLVITCIHQPSSDIYKLFDRLWLLDRGGYPIYDGNPIEAVTHFKRAANYADADTAICDVCGTINPEIMLSIVDAKALDSNGQLTDKRKVEPKEWRNLSPSSLQAQPAGQTSSCIIAAQPKKGSLWTWRVYLRRNLHCKLQDKQFLLIALLEAPILAVIVAMLTRYSGDGGYTLYENKNLLSYIFMAVIVATFMGMSVSAEEIFRDRALLRRESFLQLSYASYIFSKVVTAAIISSVQTLLFVVVGNWLMGIHCLFVQWWAVLFASSFLASMTGLFLSQRLKSLVAIYISIPLLLIPQILLCGVVVPFDDLNQHSTTRNVPLIGDIIPSRWAFEAIAVTMFTDNDYAREYFNDEARQYELQMARMGFINKINELLEEVWRDHDAATADENLAVIANEVQRLAVRWELATFEKADGLTKQHFDKDTYEALKAWLKQADKQLYKSSFAYTRSIDRKRREYIDQHGEKALVDLKFANANRQLENTLVGSEGGRLVRVEQGIIVPQMGAIYLDPPQRNGRAPFYSSVKLLGSMRIATLAFNLAVLSLMSIVSIIIMILGKKK